jgi:hypothetical protein
MVLDHEVLMNPSISVTKKFGKARHVGSGTARRLRRRVHENSTDRSRFRLGDLTHRLKLREQVVPPSVGHPSEPIGSGAVGLDECAKL